MGASEAVRRYYAERIYAQLGPDRLPRNFQPLDDPPTGRATIEGCRHGGKNILEVFLTVAGDVVKDVRLACGLCNPAMYVCSDVVADWARGRPCSDILDCDPFDLTVLDPLFGRLGGPGRPDDAREKFQYALQGLQAAVCDHQGRSPPPLREVARPTDRDVGEDGDDEEDADA